MMADMYVRNIQRGYLTVLLSLATALNVSQAMVLCVGPDGHVAVERLGHSHCGGTHASDSHCCPCTDIPIPGCSGESRSSLIMPAGCASSATPALLPAASGPEYEPPAALLVALIFPELSLRSTVLQV